MVSAGSRPRVTLLFGTPAGDVTDAARAMAAAGSRLAADADTARAFAVSPSLDALALEIGAGLGITPETPGPIAFANASATASRRRIDRQLEPMLPRAAAAIGWAIPADATTGPVLIVAGSMGLLPRFWLRAFAAAGIDVVPALLDTGPLAAAAAEPGGERLRETVFLWHHAVLEVLSAAPDRVAVLSPAALDLRASGLGGGRRAPTRAKPSKDDADGRRRPIISDQTHELEQLLRAWPSLDAPARATAAEALRRRLDDAVTLTGVARIVRRRDRSAPASASVQATPAAPSPVADPSASPLLFHFHIFKNAGTSVDRMLKANFGDAWAEREFGPGPLAKRQREVHDALAERPDLHAFSSHTAPLPPPTLDGRAVFPIIFVRHPLLRIRSAYAFERRQDAQTRGATLAKQTDLRGYLTALLDQPKLRLARNFQTLRFAAGTPGPAAQELRRALDTLARLPFVGLVEAYGESVTRLGALVRPLFPHFEAVALHENITSKAGGTTADRLASLRQEIGEALFDRLLAENAWDLELFARVSATYA